jgi:hypothetical protein
VRASSRQIGRSSPDRAPDERSDRTKVGETPNADGNILWDLPLPELVVPNHPAAVPNGLRQRFPRQSVEGSEDKTLQGFATQHIDLLPENQDFRLMPHP